MINANKKHCKHCQGITQIGNTSYLRMHKDTKLLSGINIALMIVLLLSMIAIRSLL